MRSAYFKAFFWAFVSASFFLRAAARLVTPAAAYTWPLVSSGLVYTGAGAAGGGRGTLGVGVMV
jgi:hypothetical protein